MHLYGVISCNWACPVKAVTHIPAYAMVLVQQCSAAYVRAPTDAF